MTLSEYLNMLFPFFGDRKGFGKTPKTKKGRGNDQFMQMVPYTTTNIKRQQEQLETIKRIAWQHRFRRESTQVMKDLYDKLQGVDGRSMIPNLLVRNLLICLGYKLGAFFLFGFQMDICL